MAALIFVIVELFDALILPGIPAAIVGLIIGLAFARFAWTHGAKPNYNVIN